MQKEEQQLEKRLSELSNLAYSRDIGTYSDFLNLNELNILHSMPKDRLYTKFVTFGGYGLAERQMACLLYTSTAVSPEQMKKLIEELKTEFDYILLDCPAGIEQGFQNAIAGADRGIVVTTPEVSAIRDADRIIGLLEAHGIKNNDLIINRLRIDMVKRGDMMSVEDVTEILAIHLLGVIPDDEQVVIATNQGEPIVGEDCMSGKAYANICRRLLGEEIPITDFERSEGLFSKFRDLFKKN